MGYALRNVMIGEMYRSDLKEGDSMKRNNFIDTLKGICIIFVVITHFSWSNEERLHLLFPFWIDMAVPVFMIISGYVYAASFERKQINSIESAYKLKEIVNKFIRYTIPYIGIYLAEAVGYLVVKRKADILEMVKVLLGGGYGPGSYYYPIMLQFMFIFPIIYFIIRKYDLLGVVCCGIVNGLYEVLKYVYEMNESCYRMLVFRYILLIGFGCYLVIGKVKTRLWVSVCSCLLGFVFIIISKYMGYSIAIVQYWGGTSFLAVLYVIPIVGRLLKSNLCRTLRCKFLEKLGKASFDIFLVQMFYYWGIQPIFARIIGNRIQLFTVGIFVCLLGGCVYYAIESRLTKYITGCVEQKLEIYDMKKYIEIITYGIGRIQNTE